MSEPYLHQNRHHSSKLLHRFQLVNQNSTSRSTSTHCQRCYCLCFPHNFGLNLRLIKELCVDGTKWGKMISPTIRAINVVKLPNQSCIRNATMVMHTTPINTKIDSHNSITCKWLSLQPPMRNQIFQVTQHEEDTVTVSQDTTTNNPPHCYCYC